MTPYGFQCDLCKVWLDSNNSGQITPECSLCFHCTLYTASKLDATPVETPEERNPNKSYEGYRFLNEGEDENPGSP